MSDTTDPAREFTDMCQRLAVHSDEPGAAFLARQFETSPWSTDFMRILAAIHERIQQLREMLSATELDQDIKNSANVCLSTIQNAFSAPGLMNHWNHSITNFLTPGNMLPIRMASAYVRPNFGVVVPTAEEMSEFIGLIDDLLGWLDVAQLTEKDFIRAALIDGLRAFRFKAERVGWYGWLDTMGSLREVIAAYLMLERELPDPNVSPPYEAMVRKTGEFLKTVFGRVKFVKDAVSMGDWLLRGYGALQVAQHAPNGLAGLLTHGS